MTQPDEELLPAPSRRRRVLVELVLAGLLVAALVVVAVRATGGSSHPRALERSSSPTAPASTEPATPARVYGTGNGLLAEQPPELPSRVDADPSACPWPDGCVEDSVIPAPVRAAVHAAVPGARIFTCTTVRLVTGPLWYRLVDAALDGGELLISIETPQPGQTPEPAHLEGQTTVYSVRLDRYVATVRFDWPGTPAGLLARLAHDPRLLVG